MHTLNQAVLGHVVAAERADRTRIRAVPPQRPERPPSTPLRARAAYVTGPDKVRGTVDHVKCITEPARGRPVTLPFEDAMVCAIHVDDMAEVFARVTMADKPAQRVYNSGGTPISLGEIAGIVRCYLPDAEISFQNQHGARASNATYRLDNSRLLTEFALEFPPFRRRVLQIINDTRRESGLPAVVAPH